MGKQLARIDDDDVREFGRWIYPGRDEVVGEESCLDTPKARRGRDDRGRRRAWIHPMHNEEEMIVLG